jgi:hypothetical protein
MVTLFKLMVSAERPMLLNIFAENAGRYENIRR